MIKPFSAAQRGGSPSSAKTRFKFIGPGVRTAPPIYARALAGDYRGSLLISTVAMLASASLTCPDGDSAIETRWWEALHALSQAGLLVLGADHKVSPEAFAAVLPTLKAKGLEPGEALGAWLVAAVPPGAVQAPTPQDERQKVDRGPTAPRGGADELLKRVPAELRVKLRRLNLLDHVRTGADALGAVVTLGDGDYSASTVVEVLIRLQALPEDARGARETATAIRTYYRDEGVEWKSRAQSNPEAVDQVVRCYREGQRIADQQASVSAAEKRKAIVGV